MAQFQKHFTLEQANALVPWVRSIFEKIHTLMRDMEQDQAAPPSAARNTKQTGAGQAAVVNLEQLWSGCSHAEQSQLFDQLVECLTEEGLLIYDLRRGLVHFPAYYQGREVLLCYELADGPCIEHWHETRENFSARKPTRGFFYDLPNGGDAS